ncbi:thermonuclease family protein [Pseudanabaena sp. UWO311]|uniref:thermonuclease family protein n=1 Tax=Pseudanabaena sp. UWO311 TaxID=2487337 RepID=UPI00168016C3|nr:thermonuclease family protein [Pseudanabaena sp. UWO311]
MKEKFVESVVTIIAIAGIVSFFLWQNHQREIANSPSYEGDQPAIIRPIRLADTQFRICETTKVFDGDTIAVDCDGEKLKLRFCGIDAPELSQPLGDESKALMVKLVGGKQVVIRPIERDRYGRTIAEVEVKSDRKRFDGEYEIAFVGGEMIGAGMAYHYRQFSGNCPNREIIVNAEDEAKKKKIGVWSGNFQKPWDYRKAQRSN